MKLDILVKFECKRNARIIAVCGEYSMHDLIFHVINYCTSALIWVNLSVHDKIVIKNLKKRKDILPVWHHEFTKKNNLIGRL